MSKSSRADIFQRLNGSDKTSHDSVVRARQQLGSAPAAELPSDNLAIAFLCNVLNNGGTIDCAKDRTGTIKALGAYLYDQFRTQRLVAGNDPRLAALPWRDAGLLPRFGAAEDGEAAALSYAQLAVAETGAIATFTGKASPAANAFLPEHHLVLVALEDIVADWEAAWARIHSVWGNASRPRGVNFIAGPSSTADIDGQLVAGAHGPRRWHVIVVGELPADTCARAHALWQVANSES
ncbi:MAG: lactate utilization protein C [Halioglobus sp.]